MVLDIIAFAVSACFGTLLAIAGLLKQILDEMRKK